MLQEALVRSVQEQAILVLDHFEVLDPDQRADRALKTALADPGDALVLGLYWEPDVGRARRDGSLAWANARWQVPSLPYSPDRARGTIKDHFIPHWQHALRCTFDDNAFDSVYALEPWTWVGGVRMTLPYLAVFMGKDAIETAQGGVGDIQHLVKRAQATLVELQRAQGVTPDVVDYFAPVFRNAESDLNAVLAKPLVHDNHGRKILSRGHITARLLGEDDHRFRYPPLVPNRPLHYVEDLPKGAEDPPISSPDKGSRE